MKLTSSAFSDGETVPSKYSCDGDRFLSPPLEFKDVPKESKSLILIMEDPDVPKEIREDRLFVHWVLYNISPDTKTIDEGESVGMVGLNTRGEARYTGPCPPSEYEPSEHRYIFTLYALDTILDLEEATKESILQASQDHVLDTAVLMGRYKK